MHIVAVLEHSNVMISTRKRRNDVRWYHGLGINVYTILERL